MKIDVQSFIVLLCLILFMCFIIWTLLRRVGIGEKFKGSMGWDLGARTSTQADGTTARGCPPFILELEANTLARNDYMIVAIDQAWCDTVLLCRNVLVIYTSSDLGRLGNLRSGNVRMSTPSRCPSVLLSPTKPPLRQPGNAMPSIPYNT